MTTVFSQVHTILKHVDDFNCKPRLLLGAALRIITLLQQAPQQSINEGECNTKKEANQIQRADTALLHEYWSSSLLKFAYDLRWKVGDREFPRANYVQATRGFAESYSRCYVISQKSDLIHLLPDDDLAAHQIGILQSCLRMGLVEREDHDKFYNSRRVYALSILGLLKPHAVLGGYQLASNSKDWATICNAFTGTTSTEEDKKEDARFEKDNVKKFFSALLNTVEGWIPTPRVKTLSGTGTVLPVRVPGSERSFRMRRVRTFFWWPIWQHKHWSEYSSFLAAVVELYLLPDFASLFTRHEKARFPYLEQPSAYICRKYHIPEFYEQRHG
ncbi:MAG TPA: hypothetical protein DDW52_28080 [Planctomycetaceae bacterium]|nr:hypothetical protein [Planctomycetaceae bacterium]